MLKDIMKMYDMLYSPLITPYNLLENAKLDNYSYVKYYAEEQGIIAEMECTIANEGTKVFYYHFDNNDFLQKVFLKSGAKKTLIFDRDVQLNKAKDEYYKSHKAQAIDVVAV